MQISIMLLIIVPIVVSLVIIVLGFVCYFLWDKLGKLETSLDSKEKIKNQLKIDYEVTK